ncbi:hypothetical protein SAMN05421788_102362 [Filimonas lacunae]|uniref:Uncharacterized protein n=1 Tax=Filimonas lacunae TaxID=477680 RepID=A0A1N7NDT0_9BACT|nr:hypothetical protein [Filimonas lacunae]SIS96446.1 hypothetical protein SAMN05421788_102362 [Filimonas lacunae]
MLGQNEAPLPFFFVGKTVTTQRINRFLQTKHVALSEQLGKPDTKSVWYSREHVSKLLDEIDRAGADGLRIYFGTYGEEEVYPGQTCLLMVMTKYDQEKCRRSDITIEDSCDFQARSIDSSKPRDFNVGSPCPPICDGLDE